MKFTRTTAFGHRPSSVVNPKMAEYTINTLAKKLGMAENTVRRYVARGIIKPVRVETKTIEVPFFNEDTVSFALSPKLQRAIDLASPTPARLLYRTVDGQPVRKKRKRDRTKERLLEILPKEPWRMHETNVPTHTVEEPSGELAPLPTKEWTAPRPTEEGYAPTHSPCQPTYFDDAPGPLPPVSTVKENFVLSASEPTPPPPEASPAPTEPPATIPPGERLRALEAKMGDTVEFRRLRTLVRTLTNDGLSDSAIGFAIDEYLKELAAEADEFEPEEEDL
jgi:hypothetical protein